jgi:hypothetical protein
VPFLVIYVHSYEHFLTRAKCPKMHFHGGNTGSNPVGDANKIKGFRNTTAFLHDPI